MSNLPRPFFVNTDPNVSELQLENLWVQITDKPLLPAQPEKLFIHTMAYLLTLHKIEVQYTGEQNLVNYAKAERLDHLGDRLGVTRLPGAASRCTLRFTLAQALGFNLLIPQGTRASISNSNIQFVTIAAIEITAGSLIGNAIAEANTIGNLGNEFAIGQINQLPAPIAYVQSVSNTTASSGGADIESDDRLRTRIKLAPNLFSVAGSTGAYQYHALTADPSIIDVSVISPKRGRVSVYILTAAGLPSNETLQKVFTALNPKTVRPLTDEVAVLAPTAVNFAIVANITLLAGADAVSLQALLQTAAQNFTQELRSKLGKDIVVSQITSVLSLPGVYKVQIVTPADQILSESQWANCTAITLNFVGVTNG